MKRYFLGIDVGTNESKAALIDEACRLVAFASEPHKTMNPQPGWFEHDAEEDWWGSFCRLSRRVLAESGVAPGQIGCVGLSALGCDCVPVDGDCSALCNAILYGVDSRSHREIAWLNDHYGSQAEALFGHPICSSDVAPKILWLKNERPEVYARTAKFLTGSSYLCAKLTGQYTIDQYLAEDFMPLYHLEDQTVDEEHCALFCRPDQLAQVRHATDIAGTVTPQAAALTGLCPGTPVLVGTGDSGAEAVSTGVFQPGDIMVQLGSSCFFVYLTDRLVPESRLWPGTFIIPGVWSICAGTNTAGTLTKWFRDEIFRDLAAAEAAGGENAYAAMAKAAADIPAGSDGLICLPYFAGERTPINDPFAKGMFFGLDVRHTRAHLYKAALEGIGYTIAQHFDILEENGLPVHKVMVVGGGTKNPVWLQIVADMLGRPVCTAKVTFGAAYGDAIMAALGGGAYESWADLEKVVQPNRIVQPDQAAHQLYAARKPIFQGLYQNDKGWMHQLGREGQAAEGGDPA